MHASGTLHRDLKPANVGYSATGAPKLLDWAGGFVSIDGQPILPAGPFEYMCAEALRDEVPDAAYDLWGLSVFLYVALTGPLPFGPRRADGWEKRAIFASHLKTLPCRSRRFCGCVFPRESTALANGG